MSTLREDFYTDVIKSIMQSHLPNIAEKLSETERLRQSLQSQLDTINQLPATMLRQAFNGEL